MLCNYRTISQIFKLCNIMDQNSLIYGEKFFHDHPFSRTFDIRTQFHKEQAIFRYLVMRSVYSGDFGDVVFEISASLDFDIPQFHCRFVNHSGEAAGNLFIIQNCEIAYFVLKILPLFNPQNPTNYGLSSSSSESQDL